ncbi:MAG TPA: hypothetical protein VJA40_02560, partial [archaeon]|nr:hypothetical protein [archaeon]
CGNQCGSGGNAGRPYCCPSGGTWSCSSSSCIVETPQPPSLDSCGDGICQLALEDEANCPEDCVGCNYDNSCDLLGGENCWNCGYDCYGLCLSGPSCGDGSCDALAGEACTNCAQDCGVCVGETVACSTCESCSAVLGSGKNAVIQGALGLPLILTSGSYCIDWTVPSGTTNQSLDCKGSTIKAKNAVDVYAPKSNSTLLIKNCKIDATELYSRGINYYSPSGSLNNALVLKNNTVSGQDNEGINVFRAKNIELSGNVVSNSGNGFYGGATGGAGFSENCFCENGNDVVYVYPNSSVSYSGNVCDDRFGLPAAFCAYKCESAQGIAACAEYASRNSGAFCSADSDCPLLSKCCDGVCRNTSTDALNCGACGNACATGYALGSNCVAGRCQCPIETNACDGVCVNYRTDPQNCGGCTAESEGENCLEKQEVCFTGTCGVAACTTNANCLTFGNNYKCCGKAGVVQACTNVNHNASILNCGACGNQCGSGGNAGRPYCCPSGGTFACSSAPCPPPI